MPFHASAKVSATASSASCWLPRVYSAMRYRSPARLSYSSPKAARLPACAWVTSWVMVITHLPFVMPPQPAFTIIVSPTADFVASHVKIFAGSRCAPRSAGPMGRPARPVGGSTARGAGSRDAAANTFAEKHGPCGWRATRRGKAGALQRGGLPVRVSTTKAEGRPMYGRCPYQAKAPSAAILAHRRPNENPAPCKIVLSFCGRAWYNGA